MYQKMSLSYWCLYGQHSPLWYVIYQFYQYLFVNTICIASNAAKEGPIFVSAELAYYNITVCSLPISLLPFSVINVLIYI